MHGMVGEKYNRQMIDSQEIYKQIKWNVCIFYGFGALRNNTIVSEYFH